MGAVSRKLHIEFIENCTSLAYSFFMFKYFNPNYRKKTEDCTIRAICKALDVDWQTAFVRLSVVAMRNWDMMHKNYVWGALLENSGFVKTPLPNTCPFCLTVAQFAHDNPEGTFVLGTGSHVVTVVDGDWYDLWDSGSEVPIVVYWRKYGL